MALRSLLSLACVVEVWGCVRAGYIEQAAGDQAAAAVVDAALIQRAIANGAD
jgi:hypothetical protein